MSGRETFPYGSDVGVIHAALRAPGKPYSSDYIHWDGKILMRSGMTILFYDTAGALCGILLSGSDYHYSEKIINAAMDMMGNHNDRVVREDHGFSEPSKLRLFRYYFAGTPVNLGQPFVIAGPLSIQAWRAQAKHR